MADHVYVLPQLDGVEDHVQKTYDVILMGAPLNDLPVCQIVPFFQSCRRMLRPQGFICCSILNFSSFAHILQQLPNDIPPFMYSEVPSPDGHRTFHLIQLIEALRNEMTSAEVRADFAACGSAFRGADQFEETAAQLLGCKEAQRAELHEMLLGDMVILHIS